MKKQLLRLWIWLLRFNHQKHFKSGRGLIFNGEIIRCKMYGLEGKILKAYSYNSHRQWFCGYAFYSYPQFQILMYPQFQLKNFEIITTQPNNPSETDK